MDITSSKGKKTVEEEKFMLSKFKEYWKCETIHTPIDKGSACDGFFVRNNETKALFESKCRHLTLDELEDFGTWMITHEKILKCQTVSRLLCIPFYGLLYLVDDNLIMYWKITDDQGRFLFEFKNEIRPTQYCVNGGEKLDDVALIPVSEGKFLQKK